MQDTGKVQTLSGEYSLEELRSTFHRLANISFGIEWSVHTPAQAARTFASFLITVFCYHMGIPYQPSIAEIIVDALHDEFKVYYTINDHEREKPLDELHVKFTQTDMPK